jgi:hypothetical protein
MKERNPTISHAELDVLVTLLAHSIKSKDEFHYAATKLTMSLMETVQLNSCDVYKLVSHLRAVDSQIVQRFTDTYGDRIFASAEDARRCSEAIRRSYLHNLVERQAA